jgi:putative ABC transport system permease protein
LSRAKEVGIRKVTGALRYQIFGQFICEAILIAFLSLITGFVVLKLMQQFVYVRWIVWEVDSNLILWGVFILFAILIGALAGLVPAKVLSGFQPVKVLKGAISPASFGKIGFRKSLVVIQFVVTACFIFLIANMYSQFKYMATDNENFNRRDIYNISTNGNYKLLKNDIANNKDVESIGLVSTPFGGTSAQCGIKKDIQSTNEGASY